MEGQKQGGVGLGFAFGVGCHDIAVLQGPVTAETQQLNLFWAPNLI